MKATCLAGVAALVLCLGAGGAAAASFAGYSATSDVYFDGPATLDYDPLLSGGSLFDAAGTLDIAFATDLLTGGLSLLDASFATVLDGSLLDTMLSVDGDVSDDSFSMLFSLSTGLQPYAIATFTGNLDGFGSSDFLTDGVLFEDGVLKITGAVKDNGAAVIPLPAAAPMLLAGLGALAVAARRRKG